MGDIVHCMCDPLTYDIIMASLISACVCVLQMCTIMVNRWLKQSRVLSALLVMSVQRAPPLPPPQLIIHPQSYPWTEGLPLLLPSSHSPRGEGGGRMVHKPPHLPWCMCWLTWVSQGHRSMWQLISEYITNTTVT